MGYGRRCASKGSKRLSSRTTPSLRCSMAATVRFSRAGRSWRPSSDGCKPSKSVGRASPFGPGWRLALKPRDAGLHPCGRSYLAQRAAADISPDEAPPDGMAPHGVGVCRPCSGGEKKNRPPKSVATRLAWSRRKRKTRIAVALEQATQPQPMRERCHFSQCHPEPDSAGRRRPSDRKPPSLSPSAGESERSTSQPRLRAVPGPFDEAPHGGHVNARP